MMKIKFVAIALFTCLLIGCKPSLNSGWLYGKWNYTNIEHPKGDSPDIPANELKKQGASIEFLKDNTYVIMWGGKPLSHGKFIAGGDKIMINEELPDGTTRSFPFYITKASEKELVFETKSGSNAVVTAIKE
ncbi:hypothetical protein [Mucilaginibacter xinganensis]|uniref:Lipocalin-like domain-containing protein n=1 Tax=Mucilaginibacter xinganensis TaxID=1234841 RepID=A0A223NU56_9SPHI|nr:hypothetical protein [Mucilaginibacter xinganensis]ASU33397.1 hypothetical protein MuYL_1499 [Mucilaginibacter xinganensis]